MNNTLTDQRPIFFHLITGFDIGGAERMLSRVLPRLADFRHVVISLRSDGPMRQVYEAAGLETAMLSMRNLADLRAAWRFWRLVRRYHPAVLTTYLIHADIFGRIFGKLSGIPVIVSSLRARFRNFELRGLLGVAKFFDRWVNQYVAVSEEVKRFYVEDLQFPPHKFTVVTNGLTPSEWPTVIAQAERLTAIREFGFSPEAMIIGTVSRLRPEKGVDRLIAAMAKLHDQQSQCLIIGDGPERERLEALAKELNVTQRIHFLGDRTDVRSLLLVCDIFVLPSLFEGMSNALLEAMASARPIVVTDTPENREVITDSTGCLVDTSQPEILAQTIDDLLMDSSKRSQLGQAARQRLEQHFSLPEKVEMLNRMYHRLLQIP